MIRNTVLKALLVTMAALGIAAVATPAVAAASTDAVCRAATCM